MSKKATSSMTKILTAFTALTFMWVFPGAHTLGEPQSRTDPVIDGTIGPSEYEGSINVDEGKFELFWTTTGSTIYIGMRAIVTGWISVGLDPVNIMTNSDMIFGGVSGGIPYIVDAWCTDDYGNHPEDTSFTGGSYDIDAYDASETTGSTTVEFRRAMSTGDPYDKKFVNGTSMKIMWATHNLDDDWETAKHDDADYATITLDGVPPPPPPVSKEFDGVITDGEYMNNTSFDGGNFQLYWKANTTNITIGMKVLTSGWVSLGISPTTMMLGADFLMGGHDGANAYVEDHYATTTTSHVLDTDIPGGSNDITAFNASESGGWTHLELKRALVTGDPNDKDIIIGTMSIIWGYCTSDDIAAKHTKVGYGTWRVDAAPPPPPPPPATSDLDGVITEGEYDNSTKMDSDRFELHWKLNGSAIDVGIRAQSTGYVSIGIYPTIQMKDADLIFGWVSGGKASSEDHYANGYTTHMMDQDLGGTFDIISYNGTESGGWTTFEFKRNLTTPDIYDRPIRTDAAIPLIWAISDSDDPAMTHTRRGSIMWNLSGGALPPPPPPPHSSALDGSVSSGEYTNHTTFDSGLFEIHWKVNGSRVHIAIKAQTSGWVSLGIDPESQMENADFVIGGMGSTGSYAEDHFGNTPTTHAKDVLLGGKDDIIDHNSTESSGWTTLEFTRNLTASDAWDKPISTTDLMTIIWAVSSSDDPGAKHTRTGIATWTLNSSVTPPPPPPPPPPKNSTIDGTVGAGEYDDDASFEGGTFVVYWTVNGTNVTIAMVGRTTGYVSIGFEPTVRMKDADMIFGWVDASGVHVTDTYCTGDFGPHPLDTALSGTYDILMFNGTETDGTTTIEFVRKLDTGDSKDKVVPAKGSLDILWAVSDSDDPESAHTKRGSGKLYLYMDVPHPSSGIDGRVSPGEYEDSATYDFDNYRVYWTIANGNVTMAISARTTGWISIGLDPEDKMKNADIILGWVELGKVHIVDAYSTGILGPHPPDTYLGGTTDIHLFNGTETNGTTTIEFMRKVSTGDAYDKDIPASGNLEIIWAFGPDDDFTLTHSKRGWGVLTIGPGGNGNGGKPLLDGTITNGEYTFNGTFADGLIEYHWRIDGDSIKIAMVGKTTGWVAIGIGYAQMMADSDMIFGWVDSSGTVQVVDTYSAGQTGPHPPDTEQGGTNDITSFGGKEVNGITTIEFVRKLDTGDSRDNPIPKNGTLKIIWAVGSSDSLDGMHSRAGYGTIDIVSGRTSSDEPIKLWPVHAVFMTLGTAGMIAATFVLYRRKWRHFFKFHMWIMAFSVAAGAVGLVTGFIMVEERTGVHLRVPHSWFGLVTLLVSLFALLAGYYFKYTKNVKHKRPSRNIHRYSGWAGAVLFLMTAFSGFFQVVVLSKESVEAWFIGAILFVVLALVAVSIYIFIKGIRKPVPPPIVEPKKEEPPVLTVPATPESAEVKAPEGAESGEERSGDLSTPDPLKSQSGQAAGSDKNHKKEI